MLNLPMAVNASPSIAKLSRILLVRLINGVRNIKRTQEFYRLMYNKMPCQKRLTQVLLLTVFSG